MLNAQSKQILRVGSPKISTAGGKVSTSTLAVLAAFCISDVANMTLCLICLSSFALGGERQEAIIRLGGKAKNQLSWLDSSLTSVSSSYIVVSVQCRFEKILNIHPEEKPK